MTFIIQNVIIQKQKLEELKLLKDLFIVFNKRYDKLNEELNNIANKDEKEDLSKADIDILNDYFNLCGEEYFYHKQGYIHFEVWKPGSMEWNTFIKIIELKKNGKKSYKKVPTTALVNIF